MEIRKFTPAEANRVYAQGLCPNAACDSREYLRGPSGGASVNVKCPKCETESNVMDPECQWPATMPFGEILKEGNDYQQPKLPEQPLLVKRPNFKGYFDKLLAWMK